MRKIEKNPKIRKWIKIDPKVNRALKSRPRCQFSIPNARFSISAIFSEIFYIFQNFLDFRYFSCVGIHWTPNRNCSKFVRNLDFGSKTILQPFRMANVDHIPYPDHNFWMKIDCCGIWFLTLMDFHVFYTFCTVFLYWSLQGLLWGPKMSEKWFFSTISQMAGIGRKNVFWGVRKVLQMCSPHFQTQNDDISWLEEKNIINAKCPNIAHQVRIAFQSDIEKTFQTLI